MEISGKIKELRKALDLNQTDFAKTINSNCQTISRYECGLVKPGYDTLVKLVQVHKVNFVWLISEEDNKKINMFLCDYFKSEKIIISEYMLLTQMLIEKGYSVLEITGAMQFVINFTLKSNLQVPPIRKGN
jgi:transcriptional regulator with XRE-family HTH domain